MKKLSVAEKVRVIMRRLDINMGELADATNQSRQNLSNKMRHANFSEKDIDKLAEGLGCTVDIVFTLPDGTQI